MIAAFVEALGSAVCYGVAAVLEHVGAARTDTASGLDPRFFLRLARQLPYVSGLALDLTGWVLSLAALRTLPLFAVQAAVAASIGVTALISVARGERLRSGQWASVTMIGVGLILLGVAAAPEGVARTSSTDRVFVVAGVAIVVVAAAVALPRSSGERGAAVLGGLAGVSFGGTALAARMIQIPHHVVSLVTDPLAWALAAYGVLGMLLYSAGLQRGSATAPTAALFSVETVIPAIIGVAWLGDRARPGLVVPAAIGFLAAAGGAVVLAAVTPSTIPADRAKIGT